MRVALVCCGIEFSEITNMKNHKHDEKVEELPERRARGLVLAFIVSIIALSITLVVVTKHHAPPLETNQPVVTPQVGVEWPSEHGSIGPIAEAIKPEATTNTVTPKTVVTNNTLTLNFENFKLGGAK